MALAAEELVIDNFAGGGGASDGIRQAIGRDPDVALNHDEDACAMYRINHPNALVYCQSVTKADPRDVVMTASRQRGSSQLLKVGLAWFSPDCTDHSKAKGSAPIRNRASRDLAWVIVHWAKLVKPRVILMENVEEWLGWGPLRQRRWPDGRSMEDLHGNPVWERDPERAGETFRKWLKDLRKYGYRVEWRIIRASDHGAPTIRKRLFLQARCDGAPIVWPAATHGEGLIPYRTAAECIDWSIPCPSIFDRKRPLVENSLARIGRGVWRYVINSADPFIIPVTHKGDKRCHSIREPLRTITTAPRGEHALIVPTLVQTGYGERSGQAPRSLDIHKPLGTIVAGGGKHALVAAFLAQHNGGAKNENMAGRPADAPLSTICTRGGQQQIVTSHLIKFRGTCKDGQSVTAAMPTITASGTHIGEVRAFLVKYFGTAVGQGVNEPLHTATAKARFGLVTIHGEDWQIVDIGMRMLTPRELFLAQGFRPDYVIDRGLYGIGDFLEEKPISKTAQIEKCGNSVSPPAATALVCAAFDLDLPMQVAA